MRGSVMALNKNILLYDEPRKLNTKASEEYVHVKFFYPDVHKEWDGWVPVEYRRTGVSIPADKSEKLDVHLNKAIFLMFTIEIFRLPASTEA